MYLPTLKQLNYLIALHEHKHFAKAAEACFVSQSTLSAGLMELEKLLGAQLVERTKRHVHFTELGERVVREAQNTFASVHKIGEMVEAEKEPLTGTLRLGVIPTIAPFLLPRIMPQLRLAFPKLTLQLTEGFSHIICDQLNRGELDLLLLALPFNCGPTTDYHLFNDPFHVAFPADKKPDMSEINTQDLKEETLLLMEDGHCLKDHALAACHLTPASGKVETMGTSLHTLVQMISGGMGVTLLPEMAMMGSILSGTNVATVPLGGQNPFREIGLSWRQSSPMAGQYKVFGDKIIDIWSSLDN